MDPHAKRERDGRRLTALKMGAVGLTVAGIGAFAGLAAAGTDASSAITPMTSAAAGQPETDAARGDEDDVFFDDEAYGGGIGDYQGYDEEYSDDDDVGASYPSHGGYSAPQGGYVPSQGSTGGS